MTMKVDFIGLAIMGKPMSRNLLKAWYSLVVSDRNPDAIADVIATGAETASLKARSREVIDMSSIVPLASREIREALKAKSIAMLGTPFSGDKVIFDKYYA